MVIVRTHDNALWGNTSYSYGHSFSYGSVNPETGEPFYTYPYVLILRNGELEYHPVSDDYQLYPGDKLLLPNPPINWDGTYTPPEETKATLPKALMVDALISEAAEILPKINKFKADFMFGALYEFVLNEVESAQVTGALMWNLLSAVTGDSIGSVPVGGVDDLIEGYLEEHLPQTAAFYMGRLTGSGAGMVAALYKFKAGLPLLGKGLQGANLSIQAGIATRNEKVALVGSAISAALSGSVVINSTASAVGALDGALENTAILMAMMAGSNSDGELDPIKNIEDAWSLFESDNINTSEDSLETARHIFNSLGQHGFVDDNNNPQFDNINDLAEYLEVIRRYPDQVWRRDSDGVNAYVRNGVVIINNRTQRVDGTRNKPTAFQRTDINDYLEREGFSPI